jgi:hypothetical protein
MYDICYLDESISNFNKNGSSVLAKYKNSRSSSFGKLQRKNLVANHEIGPGAYKTLETISPEGKYISSKIPNSLSNHFPKSKRC